MEYSDYKKAVLVNLSKSTISKLPDLNTLLQLWFKANLTIEESISNLITNEKKTTRKTENKRSK